MHYRNIRRFATLRGNIIIADFFVCNFCVVTCVQIHILVLIPRPSLSIGLLHLLAISSLRSLFVNMVVIFLVHVAAVRFLEWLGREVILGVLLLRVRI